MFLKIFSQQPSDSFMGDGGETHQVSGLGFKRPEIMEQWDVVYPREMTGRYGTVEGVQYAMKRDGNYERLIVDICQVGRVDVIRENGQLKNGPVWTTMYLPIAAVSLQKTVNRRDLKQIMSGLSPQATGLVEAVLKHR